MQGQMTRIDDRVGQISKTMVAQADLAANLDQLNRAVTVMTGQMEEFNGRSAMLTERMDRLEKSFSLMTNEYQGEVVERTAAATAVAQETRRDVKTLHAELRAFIQLMEDKSGISRKSHQKAVEALSRDVVEARPAAAAPAQPSGEQRQPAAAEAEKTVETYQRAYLLYLQGDYGAAVNGFSAFMKNYPSSGLADGAAYWTGESYYAMKDYPKAAEALSAMADKYPSSAKAPAALLKGAHAYLEMKKGDMAAQKLAAVLEKYPSSGEAAPAAELLKMLKPAGQ